MFLISPFLSLNFPSKCGANPWCTLNSKGQNESQNSHNENQSEELIPFKDLLNFLEYLIGFDVLKGT